MYRFNHPQKGIWSVDLPLEEFGNTDQHGEVEELLYKVTLDTGLFATSGSIVMYDRQVRLVYGVILSIHKENTYFVRFSTTLCEQIITIVKIITITTIILKII